MRKSKILNKKNTKPKFEVGSGNIFLDLGFPEDKAVSMLIRAKLAGEIRCIIRANGWTQTEAASALKIRQPRVAEIMSMKTHLFSTDLLMRLLNRLGKEIRISITNKHAA